MNLIKKSFTIKQSPIRCEVFCGTNLEKEIVNYSKKLKKSKYIIVTDNTIRELHANRLKEKLLKEKLNTILISFPSGEHQKTRETKAFVEDEMFKEKVGRDSLLIALGGGVVGDLAGFVAGTYMRGIDYIQVPTTTIAQSDSSYGGKTAVDTPAGKNLVGVFNQPKAVFVDSSYLKTLDQRNYINGLVEVIKHCLIKDKKSFELFKKNLSLIQKREGKEFDRVIGKLMMESINVKRFVVIRDEKEENLRKILNYGHTIGHAVEKLSNFGLLHGEAIAIGICVEAFLAYKTGISTKECFEEQKNIFESIGLKTTIPISISTKDIIEKMKLDKKARNALPEFSLIKSIGRYASFEKGKVTKAFSEETLIRVIDEYRSL